MFMNPQIPGAGFAPEDNNEANNVRMTLGIFADSHYAEIDALGSRRPKESYNKLLKALEHFKAEGVNMILCLGDLINTTGNAVSDLKALEAITAPIVETGLPAYCIWGNHDADAMDSTELLRFSSILSAPSAVKFGGAHLVLLDLNYTKAGDKYEAGENDWTDTAMPEDQLKWLEHQLRFTDDEVTVFCHQNIVGASENDPHMIANAAEVRRVLEKYGNVKRVYQGHRHSGGYAEVNGIEYITLKAMCEEKNTEVDDFCTVVRF